MIEVIDADELRRHLGGNILRERKQKGWSQQELCDRIGLTPVSLSRIENGHNSPSVEVLYSLADAFGCTADDLRKVCEKLPASA